MTRGCDADVTPIVLGWRELVALPELGIGSIRAKVDTGARSSCLHARKIEEYSDGGMAMVRFTLDHGNAADSAFHAAVIDHRRVRDSGGHLTIRPFIRTQLQLGGLRFIAEVNLAPRDGMRFPMLLGRTAMAGRFVVDPAASFLLGGGADEAALVAARPV